MSLVLYAVVRACHTLPVDPENLPKLILVEDDDLAVAAEQVPDDAEIGEDDARTHLAVLVELVRAGPTLPLRFGTLAPDAAVVRNEVLQPAREAFRHALDKVADLVELRLALAFDEDYDIRAVHEADPTLARTVPGDLSERIDLGRAVAERLAERRGALLMQWSRRLEHLAEDTSVLPTLHENVDRIALLAHRDRIDEIDRAVASLQAEHKEEVDMEYVGPLPVTTFDVGTVEPTEQSSSRWGW